MWLSCFSFCGSLMFVQLVSEEIAFMSLASKAAENALKSSASDVGVFCEVVWQDNNANIHITIIVFITSPFANPNSMSINETRILSVKQKKGTPIGAPL